jgi:two-component system NtrC family sensor kinase
MRRVSQYPRLAPRVQMGLRLQIVLALAGLMLLAFVPLFFAVASLTRATVLDAREHGARALGRAIAAAVSEASSQGGIRAIEKMLERIMASGEVDGACVFTAEGSRIVCVGAAFEVDRAHLVDMPRAEAVGTVRASGGRAVQIVTPSGDLQVVTRVHLADVADRGTPLVRLVALYMITFGLALLVFAYFALTRLIVRPLEQLVEAADRVANGARTLRVPRSGARELIDLGASVQAMAERLIREEATLLLKVEELTQMTTQLTRTQAQLVRSERLASVGRLAAGIAHEIGNPIAALMGIQDLLLDGQLPPETQDDFLKRMRRETERIHVVVRDLLEFARPEEKQSPERGGAADVLAVVKDVVALVRPQKVFHSVHIEAEVESSLQVALPGPRLTQVLLNMVLNAAAAIASTRRGSGRVVIRGRRAEGRVLVEVEDDGPGIAVEVRDRLFEPFATTKDIGEGIGLGLAVCRGLVEAAGGEIGVDASYRGGARFYIVLPAPVS